MPRPPKDPTRYARVAEYTLRVTVLAPPSKKHSRTRNKIHRAIDDGGVNLTLCGLALELHDSMRILKTRPPAPTCGHCNRVAEGRHRTWGAAPVPTRKRGK
jgi:hypothetical protein